MYKVYAEFESVDQSDRAAAAVRDSIPGISRVTSRKINWVHNAGADESDARLSAAADWMYTPNNLYQTGTWSAAMTFPAGSENRTERRFEPASRHEYILCIEGSSSAVHSASHLLRSLGGINVNITAAPGRFF